CVREICGKLGVAYLPPALRDPRVFFSEYLLQEAEALQLSNAEFTQLMKIMNKCAEEVSQGDWLAAKQSIFAFLHLSSLLLPHARLTYPVIIKGVCEMQLGEYED